MNMDYHKSFVKHPLSNTDGLTVEDVLHLFFDVITGNDYPDGDEWFGVEYLFPHVIRIVPTVCPLITYFFRFAKMILTIDTL